MHLKTLRLRSFRSFSDEEIPLCSDLTIFVGENNGGKSNAIDAIRLLTTPLSGRRELYCEPTDVRFGNTSRRFELEAIFTELNPGQQGRLLSAAADTSLESIVFGLIYEEGTGSAPVRPSIWAGQNRGTPEPGCQQMLRHVYLPPLRDAKRALASGNPSRIYALLKHFLGGEDQDELARRLRRDPSDVILGRVDTAVDESLIALTSGVRRQATSLGFATDEKLIDIARDLRFKLADHGITPEDLRYSGHGYANLLYMATIAVELEKVSDADLTVFLVEEPEAHLHPQLQAAVLSFLEDQAVKSRSGPSHHGPAGELQVVVATHSPNLSAWVEGKNLVVFRSVPGPSLVPEPQRAEEREGSSGLLGVEEGVSAAAGVNGPAAANDIAGEVPADPATLGRRRVTHCVPLHALGLSAVDWRKIDRYLDVTKSALLFGGRVLLVEGMSEALLLPVIARRFVLKDRPDDLRLFRSAVFVPIDGVDFVPYVRLLLTPLSGVRIADRVVVVTDGDSGDREKGQRPPGELRRQDLERIAADLGAGEVFRAIENSSTLEVELVRAGNDALLRQVYLQLHPRSERRWDAALRRQDQELAIRTLFRSTLKGDFAHLLAETLDQGAEFRPPRYLVDAIESLVR